jgi:uncharacterized protein (DUF2141 family)
MKTFFILSFSLFIMNLLMPQEPQKGNITITITSLENTEGQIRAALYNRAEGFPMDNSKIFQAISVPAEKPKTVLVFKDVPYGDYAVAILHDKNENGEMDNNVFGYPEEGYGVSNNQVPTFSAPSFEESRFPLQEPDKKILINLRN